MITIFHFLAVSYAKNRVKRDWQNLERKIAERKPKKHSDEFLRRDRILEQKEQDIMLYDPEQDLVFQQKEESTIVGFVEPKGMWSNFIMKQKLGFLLAQQAMQGKNSNKGYWVNLIKAQEISKGKEHNRGRS